MIVAVALVGVAGFTFRAVDPAESDLANSAADVIPEGAIAAGGDLSSVDVDWQLADTTLSWPASILVSDGAFYVLSTAPGKANPAPTIYASEDGVSWSSSTVRDDMWMSDMDAYAGSLYAIGTAPGTNDDWTSRPEAKAGVSTDGGESWTVANLQVAAAAPEGYGEVSFRSVRTQVAAGPQGVVGVVQSRYGLDLSPFVPEEYRGESFSTMQTDDGFSVVDWVEYDRMAMACEQAVAETDAEGDEPAECEALGGAAFPAGATVFTATWDDLGVEAPRNRYSELFFSDNGIDFEAFESPFAGAELIELVATTDGFIAVEYAEYAGETGPARFLFWSSADGRIWQQMAVPGQLTSFTDIGVFDGELVVLGHAGDARELTVFTSGDGGVSWQSDNLRDVFDVTGPEGEFVWASGTAVGPDGVVLSLFAEPVTAGEPRTLLYMSTDLTNWSELALGGIDGNGEATYIDSVALNGDVILVSGSYVGDDTYRTFTAVGTSR
jgi:hypothetical protein